MTKTIQLLWAIFLIIFPFSIRFLVYEQNSYRFGNFNPWVTGFIYLPEILLGIIFLLWFVQKIRNQGSVGTRHGASLRTHWHNILLILFVLNAYLVTLFQGDSLLAAFFVLRVFEGLVVFWLITDKILDPKKTVTFLLLGALLQIVWGFAQWKFNHSLGLTALGESILGPDVLGVAKMDLANGAKQIRAYGSFLHPNIFAGYLIVLFFLALRYLKHSGKLFWLAVFVLGLYLTQSRAAAVAGAAGLVFYFTFRFFKTLKVRQILYPVFFGMLILGNVWLFAQSDRIQTDDVSWGERLQQNVISKNMWKANPWGVGVGNFTLKMEKYADGIDCNGVSGVPGRGRIYPSRIGCQVSGVKLMPWQFQPVHNVYFLILNETGIQGLLLLIAFFTILFLRHWKTGELIPLLVLLTLAPFDHFLWDSWVFMILSGMGAGFIWIGSFSGNPDRGSD